MIEDLYSELIMALGEDPKRDGLINTPKRAAEAMRYLTQGYHANIEEVVNNAIFESDNDEMVVAKNIEFYSLCEHHLLPFFGQCHIGYIPSGKIIGISKIARIVEMFARRLQVQENLTTQIAAAIMDVTQAKGVAVLIEAQHLCMMMRGIAKQSSIIGTSSHLGVLKTDPNLRRDFIDHIKIHK